MLFTNIYKWADFTSKWRFGVSFENCEIYTAKPTVPWGSRLLELSKGYVLLMGISTTHVPIPHHLASGPLSACFPDDGTCLATKNTCILMPVTGSYTKASVKTHTSHPRSSESENLTFSHSSS